KVAQRLADGDRDVEVVVCDDHPGGEQPVATQPGRQVVRLTEQLDAALQAGRVDEAAHQLEVAGRSAVSSDRSHHRVAEAGRPYQLCRNGGERKRSSRQDAAAAVEASSSRRSSLISSRSLAAYSKRSSSAAANISSSSCTTSFASSSWLMPSVFA